MSASGEVRVDRDGNESRTNPVPVSEDPLHNTARATADDVGVSLELARRLAEEYDAVPLPVVGRAVRAAVRTAHAAGESGAAALAAIERTARAELADWSASVARASAAAG